MQVLRLEPELLPSPRRRHRQEYGLRTVAVSKDRAEIGIVGGAATIAGGAALVQASGGTMTAPAAVIEPLPSSILITGVAAIVIGLGFAGYYGWQYLNDRNFQMGGTGGVAAGVDASRLVLEFQR